MPAAYPEAVCIQKQMVEVLTGKKIADIWVFDITEVDGNWRLGAIVQAPSVFKHGLHGGTIVGVDRVANSLFLDTDKGLGLSLGYLQVTYHIQGEGLPERSHLRVRFTDDTHLSAVVGMWGSIRALSNEEREGYVERWYGRAIEPNSSGYTLEGFRKAADRCRDTKLSAKKFLHAFEPGYYLCGLDAGYAMEILHRAKIHPKRKLDSLSPAEQKACYLSVNRVTKEAIREGGRYGERDLYGNPGGFAPHVCRKRLGEPCLECGTPIDRLKFEGGTSYVCPRCQPLEP